MEEIKQERKRVNRWKKTGRFRELKNAVLREGQVYR